jgi:hypothetical protein
MQKYMLKICVIILSTFITDSFILACFLIFKRDKISSDDKKLHQIKAD